MNLNIKRVLKMGVMIGFSYVFWIKLCCLFVWFYLLILGNIFVCFEENL